MLGICIYACIKLIPFLISLSNKENLIAFEAYIDELGFKGVLLLLCIQITQVFIAIIPGEIVELIAGFLYGTWGGLAICLIGNFIASFMIYCVVKLFAKKYMVKLQEKLKQYDFLNNKKKVAVYLFIIYLIPGIPKDIITYLVPFLPIGFLPFILVTSVARIPSIISSTYSSASILDSNYVIAIIVVIIFTLLAIFGFIYREKILSLIRKNSNKEIKNNKEE